tara:strand:+ start:23235 stop:23993 length:759 start_codon:yes stop_codon:yes gene_type:complete
MAAFRLVSVIAAAGMLGTGLGSLSGCTSYTNVNGPESGPAVQDPNGIQAERVTKAALSWAVRRHPVDGPFVLNLPAGTSMETANDIAAAVGMGATIPMTTDVELPVYHVTRVWIRVSDAKVDVLYPMTDGTGATVDRAVTVWLNAGVRPWTVSRGQYWNPGTVPVPPIYIPLPEAQLQAIREAEKLAARDARQQARQADAPPATEGETPPAEPEPAEPAPIAEPAPEPTPEPDPAAVYREVPLGQPGAGGGN